MLIVIWLQHQSREKHLRQLIDDWKSFFHPASEFPLWFDRSRIFKRGRRLYFRLLGDKLQLQQLILHILVPSLHWSKGRHSWRGAAALMRHKIQSDNSLRFKESRQSFLMSLEQPCLFPRSVTAAVLSKALSRGSFYSLEYIRGIYMVPILLRHTSLLYER